MITLIAFFLILGVLVLVHELGHFLVARYFKVACEEFGIGFPPRIIGIYKKQGKWVKVFGSKEVTDNDPGSTVISLNLIPLGGFVKIKGENDNGNHESDSFAVQAAWKRALILSAGVLMNVVLAWFIFVIALSGPGLPEGYDASKAADKNYSDPRIQITSVVPKSPAEKAGIKAGDIILSIDNKVFQSTDEIQAFVSQKKGVNLNYQIKRGQTEITKNVTPEEIAFSSAESKVVGIGIQIDHIATVRYPWYRSIYHAMIMVWILLVMITTGLLKFFSQLFQGQSVGESVAGPVGIFGITGQMVDLGWAYVLQFTAALSLNLAVLNILPIPALDGGRLFFLLIEKIRGKAMNRDLEAMFNTAFFFLLILLVVVVTFMDISKLGCLSCKIKNLIR